jgi:nucleoside-diphosphate-sugar epimerase
MSGLDSSILVTGATGFLGRRLCRRIQDEGGHVIAMGRRQQEGPWESFCELDLSRDPVPSDLLEGVGTIFHLASKAHAVTETAAEANTYRPVIVEGTQRLLETARAAGVERFVYMSSVKAMGEGNADNRPLGALDEESPHSPQGPYGLAKAEAEQLVLESGIPHPVVLRPVMVYGPGEKGNLPRMIEAVRKGRFPPLPDTGNRRSMVHVDDLIEFSLRAAVYPIASGKVYILSGTDACSTRELYDAIRSALGLKPVGWSVPMGCLKTAAAGGSLLGSLLGRRMPLDRETLQKLTGSAWYSSRRAQEELRYRPAHSVASWLSQGETSLRD